MRRWKFFIIAALLLVSASVILAGCAPEIVSDEYAPALGEISAPAEINIGSDDKYDEDIEIISNYNSSAGISRPLSTLHMTGEFMTAQQMEVLKAQALSWQAESLGIGTFARFVVIDPSDGSAQHVYISLATGMIDDDDRPVFGDFEKIQIQSTDAEHVRFLGAPAGGGSGELILSFLFTKDDYEWIEIFFFDAGWFLGNDYVTELPNITYGLDDSALQFYYDIRVFC